MRGQAFLKRHELFFGAGVIAAHANFSERGFRQRDVRFLTELFANWVESSLPEKELLLQNTQVQRYLDELVLEGYARRQMKSRVPFYRLTRVGLMEMLTRLNMFGRESTNDLFFFLFYFIANYQPKLTELIEREGKQFPLALKIELETLLDWRKLIQAQIRLVETEIRKLDGRIHDAYRASQIAARMFDEGREHEDIAAELEKLHPYELNSQKPLRELICEVPVELRRWELVVGNVRRPQNIWEPMRAVLSERLAALKRLEESMPKAEPGGKPASKHR